MMVIEKNLEQLTCQFEVCEKILIDDFSLKIVLGNTYYKPVKIGESIVYGITPNPSSFFSDKETINQNVILKPGEQIIACSKHKYKLPLDYFGLVQTKGTLARLFVSATCNDGQIEPGFEGFITLEIVNQSPWTIELPKGSEVAQMYLIKCSSPALNAYNGRYSEAAKKGPTIAIFNN
ncbi:dCTP deaminase [Shewanella frigidimarina]|jgi:dCTP deaminase|uniref:dCTP deaminase n=1 Tax=Shewanella frigidimarina (strain NCIMB 400) TaxID=318167 RepID=Q07XN5_SHEFN|nr:deoxycytidine deaminase [Shewanella frigidimarina]ABI73229.1 dCTP deaminase [Shewanella frigidimarina NCIMB 400]